MITRTNRERIRTPIELGGPTRTKQSFKDQTDVNVIVRNHASTSLWTHVNPQQPTYGDFSGSVDLASAYELVDQAEEAFMTLPARVRSKVDNDPIKFLHAMSIEDKVHDFAEAGMPMSEDYVPRKKTEEDPQGEKTEQPPVVPPE